MPLFSMKNGAFFRILEYKLTLEFDANKVEKKYIYIGLGLNKYSNFVTFQSRLATEINSLWKTLAHIYFSSACLFFMLNLRDAAERGWIQINQWLIIRWVIKKYCQPLLFSGQAIMFIVLLLNCNCAVNFTQPHYIGHSHSMYLKLQCSQASV